MKHIVQGILDIWNELLVGIMNFFTKDFWAGIEIPSIDKDTGLFSGPKTIFEKWFPGLEIAKEIFVGIAMFVVLIFLIAGLLKAFAPSKEGEANHPFSVIARSTISAFLVSFSYFAIAIIQNPMASLFMLAVGPDNKNSVIYGKEGFSDSLEYDEAAGSEGEYAGDDPLGNAFSWSVDDTQSLGLMGPVDSLAVLLIQAIIMTTVAVSFVRLMMEIVERYIIMMFLYYISPMAFSCAGALELRPIFENYLRMLFSQYLLIIFDYIFIYAFMWAWQHPGDGQGNFENYGQLLLYLVAMVAWLTLGQRLDEQLSSAGLATARTGAGVLSSVLAGAGATISAARTGLAAAKYIGKGAGGAASKVAGFSGLGTRSVKSGFDKALQSPIKTEGAEAMKLAKENGMSMEGVSSVCLGGGLAKLKTEEGTFDYSKAKAIDGVMSIRNGNLSAPIYNSKMLESTHAKERLDFGSVAGYEVKAEVGKAGAKVLAGPGGNYLATNNDIYMPKGEQLKASCGAQISLQKLDEGGNALLEAESLARSMRKSFANSESARSGTSKFAESLGIRK